MKKRILLTGAGGYIGSVLVPYLEITGYECEIVDTGFFKDCLLYEPNQKAQCKYQDVRNFDFSNLNNFNAVIHLAGISNDPFGNLNPSQVYDPTRLYTRKIAEECKKQGVKFIFASSCSIYGKGTEEIVNEDSEPNPQTPYSLNKLQIEQDLLEISDKNFSPVMLRFATLFGLSPRFRLDLVVNMLTAMAVAHGKIVLNSDGQAWRPHLHIQDACQAIRCALELSELTAPLILNVGRDDQNLTVLQLAQTISALNNNCPIEFLGQSGTQSASFAEVVKDRKVGSGVDSRTYKVSFARINKAMPGFRAEWTVEKGVKEISNKLKELNFSAKDFENRLFYRLQTIEDLFLKDLLTTELFWKNS